MALTSIREMNCRWLRLNNAHLWTMESCIHGLGLDDAQKDAQPQQNRDLPVYC
jgi:hypothetical protein